jgi:hypothetical protein
MLKAVTALMLLSFAALPTVAVERASLVPEDALFDVRVSNVPAFWEHLKKSSLGKLWMDPQFQDFMGNPDEEMWQELLLDGEKTAEDDILLEQLKMLKGEVVAAMSEDSNTPYVIAAMSEDDFLHSLLLDDKMSGLAEEPFDIVHSVFQDVEVIRHISHPGTAEENSSWQAHLNNTLVMGPSKEWVERSIIRLKKDAVEEPEGAPSLNVNLPLAALIQKAFKETEASAAGGLNAAALYDSLGLMGIETFSGHVELQDDRMTVDNRLRATSLDKGVFTLLNMEPAALPAVHFIPENISMLEVGRLDLLRFWQEIPEVLMAAMPETKPQFDLALATIRQQTGIDLEQDLLAHLNTRYLGFTVFEDSMLSNVMAIELGDGAAFKHGLETLMNTPMLKAQIDMALDTVDFLDYTLYESKNTAPADAIAFAVTDGYLLYGQPGGIRQVLRSEANGTSAAAQPAQAALIKELYRHTPKSAFGYNVVDWKKNMAFVIRELTKPQVAQALLGQWASSAPPIPPPDMNKLPPADHLASFFNMSYHYIERTESGLHQKIILKY